MDQSNTGLTSKTPLIFWLLACLAFVRWGGAGEMKLDSPRDYQVQQRFSKEGGRVGITGTIGTGRSEAVTILARLVGAGNEFEEWKTISVLETGETKFQGILTAPAGGWYLFEVQAKEGETTIDRTEVEHVGVGEVFVIAGQSNSANHGEERQQTRTGMVASFSGTEWRLANDPQPGASGNGGSFMPLFGDALAERLKVPIGFVPVGVGATSVREWLPAGSRFPNPPTIAVNVTELSSGEWESKGEIFDRFVERLRSFGPDGFRAVLWHQGESDANQADVTRTLAGSLYTEYMEKLIREVDREIGWNVPWFVAQVSYHTPDDVGSAEIRSAQKALWDLGVAFEGPDTDALRGDLRDEQGRGVHFSGKGLREHAARWVERVGPWLEDLDVETVLPAGHKPLPGKSSFWFGFARHDFEVDGKPVTVICPKVVAPGRPWLWHGEFFGHKPNPDIALLGRGFHVVYMSVPDMLGAPKAVSHWNAFYKELTEVYGFAEKMALVGLSRGGLYCYNWAAANPEKVACIYGDNAVCDFKSWPGAFGKGKRSDSDWKLVLENFGFASDEEALAYDLNPVDNLAPLARAGVPLLHVYGDADEVVPWDENTGVVAERYRELGGSITLIGKPNLNHHPHGLDDSTPIIDFILEHGSNSEAKAWLAGCGGGPLDRNYRPLIRKLGTVDADMVETTPIVLNGRLWRFEWVRQGIGQQYWDNKMQTNYFRFRDPTTGEITPAFAEGHEFGSAFAQGDTVYVTGTAGRNRLQMFASSDLKEWESWTVIDEGRYGIFNTSICKTPEDYVLMFEIDKPAEEAGNPFTARFARSKDLRTWTLTPAECNYAKDRYTAPHALRWHEGWYYNFYLEAHEGYEMRVVRSKDLVDWESSALNPVLRHSPEDKLIANPNLTSEQKERIEKAINLNNSDIDFCEWQGRLVISYSWGNQLGVEHLAEAVYDGTEAQFLRGWFPEPENGLEKR